MERKDYELDDEIRVWSTFIPDEATSELNKVLKSKWINTGEKEKEFRSKAKFDFGYEKSKDEIFDILFTLRSDYYIPENLHSFLIINYQNGFKSEQNEKNIIMNKGFGHLRIKKQIFLSLNIEFFSEFLIQSYPLIFLAVSCYLQMLAQFYDL